MPAARVTSTKRGCGAGGVFAAGFAAADFGGVSRCALSELADWAAIFRIQLPEKTIRKAAALNMRRKILVVAGEDLIITGRARWPCRRLGAAPF